MGQLPLCELRFDVSGGDTSFVIKEDMIFSTLEVDADINGHSPNTVDVPPPKFRTIEEEDPYEKIEIKKSKDGTADIKTKGQEKSLVIEKDKTEKQNGEKHSEFLETSKSKETKTKKKSQKESSLESNLQVQKTTTDKKPSPQVSNTEKKPAPQVSTTEKKPAPQVSTTEKKPAPQVPKDKSTEGKVKKIVTGKDLCVHD